ncbi:MAG TPA: ATP-binding cassette domain-containing protein [Xanthobacteraceae bacterium]|nr:ATP-binding cassette domain-containing protein [Xanthobacteraceae bacterium]
MLRLESVHVSINGSPVLRDVSLTLLPGKTTVLLGRNGAGKTTTLRTIMGLLPLDKGELWLDDRNLATVPVHERAPLGIGYAPEDRRLIGQFSVEENLLLPALALKMPAAEQQQKLKAIYELLPEIGDLRRRRGGALSGGQGKMVALARALMVATRGILLDEPFQGLAPALALNYARTLARVREERRDLALLVTESSPQLLDSIVDETLLIERGHVSRPGT